TVTLAQASAMTVTVTFATADGTLKSRNGYNAATGTLTFAPGETSKAITVKVKKGNVGDYFWVNLSRAGNASLTGSQGKGTVGTGGASASGLAPAPSDSEQVLPGLRAGTLSGSAPASGGGPASATFDRDWN